MEPNFLFFKFKMGWGLRAIFPWNLFRLETDNRFIYLFGTTKMQENAFCARIQLPQKKPVTVTGCVV